MAFTQKDIEEIATFAAIRGLTVLSLGASEQDMAAYNRAAFSGQVIAIASEKSVKPGDNAKCGYIELVTLRD